MWIIYVSVWSTMANIIEINDYNCEELNIYARLNETQLRHFYEPDGGIFIAESPKTIERALNAGYTPISLLMERKHLTGEGKDIVSRIGNVPIYTSEFEVLSKITGFKLTRGALCAMIRPKLPSIDQVCQNSRRIAILENVVNPTNVGAIFRSAAALNIDGVLLSPGCSDPLSRRSIRVSMGTVFQIPWTYVGTKKSNIWPIEGINLLKEMGFATAAMALNDNSVSIDCLDLVSNEKLAIILGTEGEGLQDETINHCDYTVKIPMSHGVDSLNVAAASAVAFWALGQKKD